MKLDAHLPAVLWNLALVLEQQGNFEQAEKLYAQIPEKDPEWDDAQFRMGYLRLQRGDYKSSIEAFEGCPNGDLTSGPCGLTAQLLLRISPPAEDPGSCPATRSRNHAGRR